MQLWAGIEDSSLVSGPGGTCGSVAGDSSLVFDPGSTRCRTRNFSECLDMRQIGLHLLSWLPLPRGEGEVGRTAVRPYQPALEASAEADFSLQRRVIASTGLDPRHTGVAVCQAREVFIAIAWNSNFSRQANIKVRIEGPNPLAPNAVVLRLANTPTRSPTGWSLPWLDTPTSQRGCAPETERASVLPGQPASRDSSRWTRTPRARCSLTVS